jgi:4-carboxymuconolactone decarboxylase
MSDKERLKRGREMFKEVYNDVIDVPKVSTPMSDFSLKTLFAEVLANSKLSGRDRRLLILGMLAGLGADPSLFDIHTRSAVRNGEIDVKELDDILLVLVNYVGFPRAAPLSSVCGKIAAEEGKGKKSKKK